MTKSLALALITSSVAFAAWSHDAQATVVLSDNFTSATRQTKSRWDNWQGDSVFTSMPDPSVPAARLSTSSARQSGCEFPELGANSHVECRGFGWLGRHPSPIIATPPPPLPPPSPPSPPPSSFFSPSSPSPLPSSLPPPPPYASLTSPPPSIPLSSPLHDPPTPSRHPSPPITNPLPPGLSPSGDLQSNVSLSTGSYVVSFWLAGNIEGCSNSNDNHLARNSVLHLKSCVGCAIHSVHPHVH